MYILRVKLSRGYNTFSKTGNVEAKR